MKLSGLVIAVILLISTLSAQRTSAGGAGASSPSSASAPSAPSSSPSSSSSTSSSSSAGSSHSGYSGGASSASPSSSSSSTSSHSSSGSSSIGNSHGPTGGASSASGHNSGNSTSRVSSPGAVGSHMSGQTSRVNNERALHDTTSDKNRKMPVESGKLTPPSSTKARTQLPPVKLSEDPEHATPPKRSFFSRLRHPFKPKPTTTAALHPAPCRRAPCPVCPPGEKRNGKGVCVAVAANNSCQGGLVWNGGACAPTACQAGTFWNGISCVADASQCASFDSRAAMLANEMRGTKSEMDRACMQDPFGQRCRELTMEHDGQLLRYRGLMNEAPVHCRMTMPDPLSL